MATLAPISQQRPTRGLKSLLYNQKLAPYIFILPFILTLGVFWIAPLVSSFVMSTQEILYGEATFIGGDNYTKMFRDRIFWQALGNSLRYMVCTLVILIPFPLIFAVIINSKIGSAKVKSFFKTAMFIPALTTVVVAGIVFRLMFSETESAMMNQVMDFLGFGPVKWLKGDLTGLFALLAVATWRWAGVNTMYFLAGLQAIPTDYYEAAEIDGAGPVQRFFHVTLPNIKPTMIYVLTISVYGGLAMFVESFILYAGNDSPMNYGLTIVGYLYRKGIEENDMGLASAVGVVLLVIVMVINLIQLTATGAFRKENTR